MRLNSDAFGSCIEVVKQQWFMVMVDRKKIDLLKNILFSNKTHNKIKMSVLCIKVPVHFFLNLALKGKKLLKKIKWYGGTWSRSMALSKNNGSFCF